MLALTLGCRAPSADPLPTIPANQWKPGPEETTDGQPDLVYGWDVSSGAAGLVADSGLSVEAQGGGEPVGLDAPLAAAPGVIRSSSGLEFRGDAFKAAAFDAAGVPAEWRADLDAIIECETRWNPLAVGDNGNSLGLGQLWFGWAREGEDLLDPVVNLRVAVRVRELRGRFGGGGGWSCADLLGIE